MTEPQYVDDPFGADDSWKYATAPIEKALLKAGMRKYYQAGEKDRFGRILSKMRAYTASENVFKGDKLLYIPTQFVLEIITWAQRENHKTGLAKIKVGTIINMCKDPDRISTWLKRHKKEEEDRSGYTDTSDGW
jgi:hypothetical protein